MYYCINILLSIISFYNAFLIAGIILTWIPFLYKFKFFRGIRKICDWYLGPFSGVLVLGPLDFTPIVGFVLFDGLLHAILYLLNYV